MPLYDYRCSVCEHKFEERNSISEMLKPCDSPCPECGKMGVEKEVGAPPLVGGIPGMGSNRVPSGFRDVVKKIKKAHPRHKIDGEFNSG